MSFLQLHILVLCESIRVLFPRTVHHMFLLQARLLGIKPCGDHMSLWNAVKDVSHPLWQQQIELKSEDQIPVQRQPGCYPDRGTPCVCRVPFQPLICLRTITCLELPVKNTVGSGSQKHRQAQQSWLFLPAQIKSSFVAIWRVLTTTNETELHTSIQACDLSLRWYNAAFFLSVQVQTSTLSKKAPTAISNNSMILPLCPPLPDILRKKKLLSSSCSPPEPEKMIQ